MNYIPVTLNEKRKFPSEILKILTETADFFSLLKNQSKETLFWCSVQTRI